MYEFGQETTKVFLKFIIETIGVKNVNQKVIPTMHYTKTSLFPKSLIRKPTKL
jgi:hypothetical protein